MAPDKRRHALLPRPVILAWERKRSHLDTRFIFQIGTSDRFQYAQKLRVRIHISIFKSQFPPKAFVYKESADIDKPRHGIHLGASRNMRTAKALAQESCRINLRHQVIDRTNMPSRSKMRNPRRTQLNDIRGNLIRIRKCLRDPVKSLAPGQGRQLYGNPRFAIELFHKTNHRVLRSKAVIHNPNRQCVRSSGFSSKGAKHKADA